MQKFLSLVSALFLALSLCACTPAADISESSAPPEISEAPEISSAPEKSEESDAPEKSEPPEASAPEQSETEEPTISEPVKSCDETGEEYCEKYVAPWTLDFFFAQDFDETTPPEHYTVSYLMSVCQYLAYGDVRSFPEDGRYSAEEVEGLITSYFSIPPEQLRERAGQTEGEYYEDGHYRLMSGFGGYSGYPAVDGYVLEGDVLTLECSYYFSGDEPYMRTTLRIRLREDGFSYLSNHVEYMIENADFLNW